MTTEKRILLATGVLGALVAAWAASAGSEAPPAELERARKAAQQLKGELMKSLTAALAEGGAPQGVRVCAEIAPGIAAGLSKDGMAVRRVTTRPRNPANAPDAWETAQLERSRRRTPGARCRRRSWRSWKRHRPAPPAEAPESCATCRR